MFKNIGNFLGASSSTNYSGSRKVKNKTKTKTIDKDNPQALARNKAFLINNGANPELEKTLSGINARKSADNLSKELIDEEEDTKMLTALSSEDQLDENSKKLANRGLWREIKYLGSNYSDTNETLSKMRLYRDLNISSCDYFKAFMASRDFDGDNNIEALKYLCDRNQEDRKKWSPILLFFIENGTDSERETTLHYAINLSRLARVFGANFDLKIIKEISRRTNDLEARNESGKTPRELADSLGLQDVVEFLDAKKIERTPQPTCLQLVSRVFSRTYGEKVGPEL